MAKNSVNEESYALENINGGAYCINKLYTDIVVSSSKHCISVIHKLLLSMKINYVEKTVHYS